MNKLELLYKVSKEMKSKEKVSGNAHMQAFEGEKQIANITNSFVKDSNLRTLSVDIHALANLDGEEIQKDIKKELNFDQMHKKHEHHGKHHHCSKKGCNKFAKLEMLFKTLNDLKVSEENGLNVLELDVTEILEKKKAKMAKKHEEFEKLKETPEFKERLKKFENCEFKDLIQLKHKLIHTLMASKTESAKLKVVIGQDFSIQEVFIKSTGEKNCNVSIKLNY